jgi:hypothetical protein
MTAKQFLDMLLCRRGEYRRFRPARTKREAAKLVVTAGPGETTELFYGSRGLIGVAFYARG